MSHHPEGPPEPSAGPDGGVDEPPPQYTKYRAGPRFLRRSPRPGGSLLDGLREAPVSPEGVPGHPAPPQPGRRRRLALPGRGRRGPRGPFTVGRAIKWVVLWIVGWIALSLVLFMVSAQLRQGDLSGKVGLGGAGYPLFSPNTILVLGSDQRTSSTKEPGGSTSGPSRSDSILLMRTGGGASARLSIPRDTVVDIPGHGRDKINAAYAYGGPDLAVRTIEQYLGLQINHLIEVDFANFPDLIDAMGGVDYTGGCVVSRINGGFRNGGYTLRLKKGTTHIDGRQALALARTRKNDCNPNETDLTRARRQQKILSAMKSRVASPSGFLRLPWISWNVPKALRSDMSGPTLLGVFGALATSGSPETQVLRPDRGETAPGGGLGLHVSDAEKQREVRRFLAG
jgi:LCP family protein required for cell wall assembly